MAVALPTGSAPSALHNLRRPSLSGTSKLALHPLRPRDEALERDPDTNLKAALAAVGEPRYLRIRLKTTLRRIKHEQKDPDFGQHGMERR